MTPHALVSDLQRMLTRLNLGHARDHSFTDYHAHGFDYLNLFRSELVTVKLYMSRPRDLITCGNADYLVNPHDHAYDFETVVVDGWVENVGFQWISNAGVEHSERYFYWRSRTMISSGARKPLWETRRRYQPGDRYALTHDRVHTIVVPKDKPVCLLIVQHEDKPKECTRLYTREGMPGFGGLYNRPSMSQMRKMRDRALAHVESLAVA